MGAQEDGVLCGLVINWGAVDQINLHVDPLVVSAKVVLDGTGHGSGIGQMIVKKGGSLKIKGEKFMWAARGEEQVRAAGALPPLRRVELLFGMAWSGTVQRPFALPYALLLCRHAVRGGDQGGVPRDDCHGDGRHRHRRCSVWLCVLRG